MPAMTWASARAFRASESLSRASWSRSTWTSTLTMAFGDVVLPDGGEHLLVGVGGAGFHGDADEGAARHLHEAGRAAPGEALATGLRGVELKGHEALGRARVAEVDLAEGAGVPAGRVGIELHGVVVVSQRDIIEPVHVEGAEGDAGDRAALHPELAAAVLGDELVAEGQVAGEDGGNVGVDVLGLGDDEVGDGALDELVELLDGGALRLLAVREELRDLRPGHECDLQRPGARLDHPGARGPRAGTSPCRRRSRWGHRGCGRSRGRGRGTRHWGGRGSPRGGRWRCPPR